MMCYAPLSNYFQPYFKATFIPFEARLVPAPSYSSNLLAHCHLKRSLGSADLASATPPICSWRRLKRTRINLI